MSLTVNFGTQKTKVKVRANATLSQLLQDAIQAFGIASAESPHYQLKYKGVALNPSLAFNLSGIPANGQVELCRKDANVVYRNCKVSIGGDVENCVKTFKSNTTLADVINEFSLHPIVFPSHFSIVCLRQTIHREDFSTTTLYDLGLDGQSAKLQIRKLADLINDNTTTTLPTETMEVDQGDAEVVHEEKGNTTAATADISDATKSEVHERDPGEVLPLQCAVEETKACDFQNSRGDAIDVNSFAVEQPMHDLNFFPQYKFSLKKLKGALEKVMNSNFDEDSRRCLLILVKYIDNLIKYPYAAKYRSINAKNAHFQNSVVKCGAECCLDALGFKPIGQIDSIDKFEFSYEFAFGDSDPSAVASSEDRQVLNVGTLYEARSMLVEHLEMLGTPHYDIPPLPRRVDESDEPSLVVPFDPFKPLIVSTSADAVLKRDTDSSGKTNHELEVLKQRKLEIEGNPEAVDRQTIVYIVNEDKKKLNDQQNESKELTVDNDADLDSYNPEMSKSLIAAIKRMASENEAPLTTKALKEIQKLKSELVYNETTIKIRILPHIIAVGHFHPRHSIATLLEWLQQDVLNDTLLSGQSRLSIFRAPPKEILPDQKTLEELGLVPAATLYISGLADLRSLEKHQILNPSVAVAEVQSERNIDVLIPKAQKLIPETRKEDVDGFLKDGKSVEAKSSLTTGAPKKMPAWLKLK